MLERLITSRYCAEIVVLPCATSCAAVPSCHDLNLYARDFFPTLGSSSEGLGLQTFSKSITNAWVVFKGEALRKTRILSRSRQQFWQGPRHCSCMSFLMFLVPIEALHTGSDKDWAKTSAKGKSPSTVWRNSIAGHSSGKPWQTCGGPAAIKLQCSINASRYQCRQFTSRYMRTATICKAIQRWKRISCLDIGHLHL